MVATFHGLEVFLQLEIKHHLLFDAVLLLSFVFF